MRRERILRIIADGLTRLVRVWVDRGGEGGRGNGNGTEVHGVTRASIIVYFSAFSGSVQAENFMKAVNNGNLGVKREIK